MRKPRILLADDHAIVLEGLKSLLQNEFQLVGTAEDGRSLLEAATNLDPDVILLDISMPRLNGLEAARSLHRANSKAKVIAWRPN